MNQALETYTKVKQDDEVVHIKDATLRNGELSDPFSIGYDDFDDAMKGGVREGDLVIITGKTGAGKTTLLQNISVNLSKQMLPSLFFSYEVLLDNLFAKFISMGMSAEELHIFVPRRNTSGNLKWVKEKIKEGLEKYKTKFVFIDHLDALSPTNLRNSDQLTTTIRNIMQELKDIALELKIIIFLVSHVRKGGVNTEIILEDLADSRSVSQIADYVMSVKRIKEVRMVDGERIEIEEDRSVMSILKSRLTGIKPRVDFVLENNIIKLL